MTTVVTTCWGPKAIEDGRYWHLVAPSCWLFYHNIKVGKGVLSSTSTVIEATPELRNAQTPYSFARRDDPKEALFEEIRRTKYPGRPSRLKTLFVFDEYSLAERALKEWYRDKNKVIYECRVLEGAVTHKADTAWLNVPPEQWSEGAEKYWQGIVSQDPFPEVLVHGMLYFPGWEEFQDL